MIKMIALMDASPLMYLAQIGALKYMTKKKKKIITTQKVKDEVLSPPKQPDQIILTEAFNTWLTIEEPKNNSVLKQITQLNLHVGEASIIALALEYKKDHKVMVIDDRAAREVAINLNLQITGTLGLLIRMVKEGLITKEKCLIKIKRLNLETSFRMNVDLLYTVQDVIHDL